MAVQDASPRRRRSRCSRAIAAGRQGALRAGRTEGRRDRGQGLLHDRRTECAGDCVRPDSEEHEPPRHHRERLPLQLHFRSSSTRFAISPGTVSACVGDGGTTGTGPPSQGEWRDPILGSSRDLGARPTIHPSRLIREPGPRPRDRRRCRHSEAGREFGRRSRHDRQPVDALPVDSLAETRSESGRKTGETGSATSCRAGRPLSACLRDRCTCLSEMWRTHESPLDDHRSRPRTSESFNASPFRLAHRLLRPVARQTVLRIPRGVFFRSDSEVRLRSVPAIRLRAPTTFWPSARSGATNSS